MVIQVPLVTKGHLVLMDLKDLRVMLDLEAQLETKDSMDLLENLLVVVIVTIKIAMKVMLL